jgi:hypothetical protein
MSIAGSVTTVLSVIGWPALVYRLFAGVTRDLPKAAKAGFRGALLGLAVIVSYGLLLVLLAGWGRGETYRYKLTLSVDTPDGVKTASNVVELRYFPANFPAQGEMHDTTGQALYLNPGPGRRPLIALLTHIRRDEVTQNGVISTTTVGWEILPRTCSQKLAWAGLETSIGSKWRHGLMSTVASRFQSYLTIFPTSLPSPRWKDPKSVALVDPFHLAATLGAGVSWTSMRLEVTDERLTKGIDDDLSWVRSYDRNIQVPSVNSFNSLQNYIDRRDYFLEK